MTQAAGRACRSPPGPPPPAAAPARRARGPDPQRACGQLATGRRVWGRSSASRPRRSARCWPAQGASRRPARAAPRGGALRARSARGAAARRHQAPGALPPGRKARSSATASSARPRAGWHHLHVADRRPHPDRLLRGARRPGRRGLVRLSRAGGGLVRDRTRHPDRARAHRQWPRLSLTRLARSVRALGIERRRTRPYTPAHQRQGRSLHRHDAARVGLPLRLSLQAPTAPAPSQAGCAGTTGDAPTAPSATGHRSAVSRRSVVSSPRPLGSHACRRAHVRALRRCAGDPHHHREEPRIVLKS